jgi:hypothetical protein
VGDSKPPTVYSETFELQAAAESLKSTITVASIYHHQHLQTLLDRTLPSMIQWDELLAFRNGIASKSPLDRVSLFAALPTCLGCACLQVVRFFGPVADRRSRVKFEE